MSGKKNKKVAKKIFLLTLANGKLPEKKKKKNRRNFPNTEAAAHRYS